VVGDDLELGHVDGGGIDNAHTGVCEDCDGPVPGSDKVRIGCRGEEVKSNFPDIVGLMDGQTDCRFGR
jgi:hypothetical protein